MRPDLDTYFIRMTKLVASRATCLRRAVGCVLVNERGHVLATGYNGRPSGWPHCNDERYQTFITAANAKQAVDQYLNKKIPAKINYGIPGDDTDPIVVYNPNACQGAIAQSGTDLDGCEAVHAEQNALLQCPDVFEIATCYVTTAPCVTCTKLLLNTSCYRIVFGESYAHDHKSCELWMKGKGDVRVWMPLTKGV